MRLHALRMRAFGPFAGVQSIDFAPLGAGGLFLLDGPTGAGKSTVLDAITFALYGPGDGGGWGRLHSHFAPSGVEPEVCLDFSLRGVRQRVTRSPEYTRPKRRGDGTVREKAQVHLERWDGGRWVTRSANKAEVGEMLADDIGLSRDQFTQVVLLPQGEFMRFLRADDDERRALLTKLFGTQLYDRITDELDRRRLVATRDLDAADKRLRARIAAAGEAAGLDPAAQDELAALAPDRCADRLDEIDAALETAARSAERAAAAADRRLATSREKSARADALADRAARFAAACAAQHDHEQSRPQYAAAAAVLAAAERAEPVRPLLDACAAADAEASAALAELRAIAPGAAPAWRRGEGAAELRAAAARAAQTAAALDAAAVREQAAGSVRAAEHGAREALSLATAQVTRLAARAAELPALRAAAAAAARTAHDQAAALHTLERDREAVLARLAAVRALAALAPQCAAAQQRREASFVRYERAVTEHLRLVEARLANMAGELAAALVDGEPCAVCGAPEHPAPARPSPDAASAADVAAAQARRAAAERERDAAVAELGTLAARQAALVERADGAAAADLDERLLSLDTAIAAAERSAARLDALDAARAALDVETQQLADAQQAAVAAEAAARSRADAAAAALAELSAELRAAADGHPSVAARQETLRQESRALTSRADAVAALRGARAVQQSAQARAAAEAETTGFGSLEQARAAVLPRTELDRLRAHVAHWQAAAAALHGAIAVAEFAGLDADTADALAASSRAAADTAQAARADAETAAQQRAVEAHRAATGLHRFRAACADVAGARAEHGEAQAANAPVVHLAKLAKGVAGQRRVALTTYVLRQWFEQVVAAANVRLSGMSSGRYELVRVDEGTTRAERVGLTLRVLDRHTGEQRCAQSLSGGETFYTSLALALGLADVVRAEAGGVDLDTLFIDEGFGSLDADTLDQVMGVIDELRDHGRTVGIVSHVSELKERIAERIEVRRLPDGSSTLRVVA